MIHHAHPPSCLDSYRGTGCRSLRDLIHRITVRGMERGEIRPDVDPDALATVMVSMLEGALALTRFYGRPNHIRHAAEHLRRHLEESVRA